MSCSKGLKYKKGMGNTANSSPFIMGQLCPCPVSVEMAL